MDEIKLTLLDKRLREEILAENERLRNAVYLLDSLAVKVIDAYPAFDDAEDVVTELYESAVEYRKQAFLVLDVPNQPGCQSNPPPQVQA